MIKFHPALQFAAAVGSIMLASQAAAQAPAQLEANQKLVLSYVHEVLNAQDVSKVRKFLDENYIEHSPPFPPGRAGFEEFFGKQFPKPKAPADVKLTQYDQVLAQGDLVQTMMKVSRPDPNTPGKTYESFWFDMFRVKNGKIVEHWDGALKTSPGMSPHN